jgi:WD40 repeat protein
MQVRIFDCRTGAMLQEVRRGNEFATIYSIAFSREGNWLAVSSDSCNLHIFVVKPTEGEVDGDLLRSSERTASRRRRSCRTRAVCFSS